MIIMPMRSIIAVIVALYVIIVAALAVYAFSSGYIVGQDLAKAESDRM